MRTRRMALALAALLLASGSLGELPAQQPSREEILAEVRALRERLERLEKLLGAGAPPAPQAITVSPDAPEKSAEPLKSQTPETPPVFSAGPIDFSGLVDSYYSLNFNHPSRRVNQARLFDTNANQFSLNMAKVSLYHLPDPVGFRLDLGLGPAFDAVHAGEPGGLGPLRYIQQAYFTYHASIGNGLVLDAGKFVSIHGAEAIETLNNWNYSRSLLFQYATPYYHFGLRASYPLSRTLTGSVLFVNGWNNVVDNNTGKTWGFQGAWSPNAHFSLTSNYMFGPEKIGSNRGYRHLSDTTATIKVNRQAAFMVNYDYGVDLMGRGGRRRWTGVAGYARLSPRRWFAFVPRLEWFNDADGFTTGVAQKLKETTLTAEFKMKEGLLTRLEYRRDWSDRRFFDRGNSPAASRTQDTLLAGFVVAFGPKR